MSEFFDSNMEYLKKKNPELAEKVGSSSENSITAILNKNGEAVPQVQVDERKLFVHSKFAPYKEAERFLSDIEFSKYDLFVVFGFGYGYHLELMLDKMSEDANLLVINHNYEMIHSAVQNRDLSKLFKDKRLQLLVDPHDDDVAVVMQGKSSHNINFVTHRGSFQLAGDYYKNLSRLVKSYISTKEVNIATLAKFEKTWSANISRNIDKFIKYPGVNSLYNKFNDYTALVVAAGPSLLESIPFIKKIKEQVVIVAVDTAYLVLKQHDIEPDFCLAVDPQVINARYFEGDQPGKTILVADPTVHPSVLRLFKSRVMMTGMMFDMLKWIENFTGEKGEITHGGSVSTNAYDFAKRLGVDKVIMVGQDLAFTNNLAHVRGSYLDEQIHNSVNRFKNAQMFNRRQLSALPKILIDGIKTKTVHTNQKMIIFKNWFEKRTDNNLVNATNDGALLKNIKHLDPDEVEIIDSNGNCHQLIEKIYNENQIDEDMYGSMKNKFVKKVEILENEMDSLLERLNSAVEKSDELVKLIEKKSSDKQKISYILNKLQQVDEYIESRAGLKDMIGITVQRVIHTITEGYELEDESDDMPEEVKTAKRSLFLYKGLKDGAAFNKRTLGKMQAILV